jgi:hypothetical protein
MESRTRFTVDAEHCQRAADELYEIFRVQQRGFVERWNAARTTRGVLFAARWVGALFSLLGLSLSIGLLYFDTQAWATQPPLWSIPVFAVALVFFVFMPWVVTRLHRGSFRRADGNARRQADKGVRQARALAPYEAEFDFRGDLLIYLRSKEGQWTLAWSRMLGKFRDKGVAIQAGSVTVIFGGPKSLTPEVIILQRDPDWTAAILQDAGIALSRFPLPIQRNP